MIGPELKKRKLQRKHHQDGTAGAGLEQQKGLEGEDAKGKGVVEHDANDEDSSDLDSLFGEAPEVENCPDNGKNDESDDESTDETTRQSATDSPIKRGSSRIARKHEASSPVEETGAEVEKNTEVDMTGPKACDAGKKPQSAGKPNSTGDTAGSALTAVKLRRALDALEKEKPRKKQDLPTQREADTERRSSKRKLGNAQMCDAGSSGDKRQRTMQGIKKLAKGMSAERSKTGSQSEGRKPSKMASDKATAQGIVQRRTKATRP